MYMDCLATDLLCNFAFIVDIAILNEYLFWVEFATTTAIIEEKVVL